MLALVCAQRYRRLGAMTKSGAFNMNRTMRRVAVCFGGVALAVGSGITNAFASSHGSAADTLAILAHVASSTYRILDSAAMDQIVGAQVEFAFNLPPAGGDNITSAAVAALMGVSGPGPSSGMPDNLTLPPPPAVLGLGPAFFAAQVLGR
jgi:hypothetical protein